MFSPYIVSQKYLLQLKFNVVIFRNIVLPTRAMPHMHPTSSAEKNLMFLNLEFVSVCFFKAAKSYALQIEISKLFRIQPSKEKGFFICAIIIFQLLRYAITIQLF